MILNQIVQNEGYKNWMKVVVALRMLNEFSIPIVEKVMLGLHQNLVDKYGAVEDLGDELDVRMLMIEEIRMMHRQTVYAQQVKRCCDVSKWLTEEGPWEIAKVFFGHTQRNFVLAGPEALDASKVLNLMVNCRIMEDYIEDFETCRMVLKVRNKVMHSSKFELDDMERSESFDAIYEFLDSLIIPSTVVTVEEIIAIRKSITEIRQSSLKIQALKSEVSPGHAPSPSGTNNSGISSYCLNVIENNIIQVTTLNGSELAKLYLVRNQNDVAVRRSCSEISFSSLARAQQRSNRFPEIKVLLSETASENINDDTPSTSKAGASNTTSTVFDPSRKRKIRRVEYCSSKRRKFSKQQ